MLESINSFQNHKTSNPNPYQNAFKINPKYFQNSIETRSKNEALHVARGGVFSATDGLFSAMGDVFEAFGRGAASGCQKGERAGCFGNPRDEPF